MTFKQVIVSVFAAFVLIAPVHADPVGSLNPEQNGPKSVLTTKASDILKDLSVGEVGDSYLLAVGAENSFRPLYVEYALIAITLKNPTEHWRLIDVYRHPQEHSVFVKWHVSHIFDLPGYKGEQDFDHKPSRADISSFLKATQYGLDTGFYQIDDKVFTSTWLKTFGVEPFYINLSGNRKPKQRILAVAVDSNHR